MTAVITFMPGREANLIDDDTGEVLFTALPLSRRGAPGDARLLCRRSRKVALVLADELFEAVVKSASGRRLFVHRVTLIGVAP